jgi:hypothetical protein
MEIGEEVYEERKKERNEEDKERNKLVEKREGEIRNEVQGMREVVLVWKGR